MARDTLAVSIDLDHIHCFDEGDGWGSAEPYLWTVFFKVDGTTTSITSSLNLAGTATVAFTPGSHGNLGDTDVDAGDDVGIPGELGQWHTQLVPIAVPPPFNSVAADVGGVVGVVVVLMEEDNVSDDGAEAGHQALNNAVTSAINQIVATRTVSNQDVTDEEIAGFESAIESAVSDAIQNEQGFFENIWSWINPDDTIGFKVFLFKHDDLAQHGSETFSKRWNNEGDWEIFGNITATKTCPADAVNSLLGVDKRMHRVTKESRESRIRVHLERLHAFRDGAYRDMPGIECWWRLAERNVAEVARLLIVNPELREQMHEVLAYASEAVDNLDAPVDEERLESITRLMRRLADETRSRRLRMDATRSADVIPALRAKSVREAARTLAAIEPARHPRIGRLGALRIAKPVEQGQASKRSRTRERNGEVSAEHVLTP
jgi:hypothetical protein